VPGNPKKIWINLEPEKRLPMIMVNSAGEAMLIPLGDGNTRTETLRRMNAPAVKLSFS